MKNKKWNGEVWEGVYSSFEEASTDEAGPGFSGKIYRERSLVAANKCLDALRSNKPIPNFHKQRTTALPITVAMIMGQYIYAS